jgi:ribosomal protein L30E
MKNSILIVLLLALSSFAIKSDSKKEVLYKTEKGNLTLEKDFFEVNFDINFYKRGEGNHVEIFVFSDEKKYLGSVDETDYKINKLTLINNYNDELKKIFNQFDYSDRILRVEKRNRKCYFFYYNQLAEIEIGRLMSDGRYCVGAHNTKFQVREKRVIIILYLDGKYKYGEKMSRDSNYKIVDRKDFMMEHLKTTVN